MRITADTPLKDLTKLRQSFVPRWTEEASRLSKARELYQPDNPALAGAEQRYADFETVATAVIQIHNLRTELGTTLPAAEDEAWVDQIRHIQQHLASAMRNFDDWENSAEIRNRPFGEAVSVPSMAEAYSALSMLNDML